MIAGAVIICTTLICASPATSQTAPYWKQWYGDQKLLVDLLAEGYEIKAAIGLKDADILYVQKGASAYRCLSLATGMVAQLSTNMLKCGPLQKPKLDR